jgi:hypothetical protein
MATNKENLSIVQTYVADLFKAKLPAWAVYHNLEHTEETVRAAREVGKASDLSKAEMEIVELAAWLHDVGYIEGPEGHEERSATAASGVLRENGYPEEKIDLVQACIRATAVPQKPMNLLERVLCDADIIHVGKKRFFTRSDLLRSEVEMRKGNPFTDLEWLTYNIEFVTKHNFHTKYAQEEFSTRRAKNLVALQDRFREAMQQAQTTSKKQAMKLEKANIPERGIETMFRVVPRNHLDLSALADHKANIMISTNALILSLAVGFLMSKLDTNPHLIIPTFILLGVCCCALVLAILATRPQVTSGTFTREDIRQKKTNLLFFGNFHRSTLEDFDWGMKEMMRDREYLYGSMIKDLYFLGKVLGVKYRYLRICYTVFMYGLIVAILAYIITFATLPPTVD